MEFTYKPKGVCSKLMELDIEYGKIQSLKVSGNLQGIARLVAGMDIDEAISRMEGIRCGYKSTSCPDQLAQALKAYKVSQT